MSTIITIESQISGNISVYTATKLSQIGFIEYEPMMKRDYTENIGEKLYLAIHDKERDSIVSHDFNVDSGCYFKVRYIDENLCIIDISDNIVSVGRPMIKSRAKPTRGDNGRPEGMKIIQ